MCGGDGGGSLVPDVKGDGEDEAVGVIEVILHGALVPNLVSRFVVHLAEVSVRSIVNQRITVTVVVKLTAL